MSTKTCQICGQEKPAEAFSKSYPNRCRECVAEQTRQRRKGNGIHATTVILDDPILPDFLREAPRPEEDKWEDRHYKLALALFFKLLASDDSNAEIAATRAKSAADIFINIMQDNDQ